MIKAERLKNQRVSITTLGCKSNQYDSSAIEEALCRDFEIVRDFPSRADAYIINTCTVTGRTDRQSRQLVRKARSLNPDAVVIVTGCYAEVFPGQVASMEGVDYILGNPEKGKVLECLLLGRRLNGAHTIVGGGAASPFTLRARAQASRTRANLKIQDGCSRACAYCIIPRARGTSRSLPLEEAEKEIELLLGKGFKEIVLTGIHLGAYAEDTGGGGICSVLNLIEKRGWMARFRLSSLDPDEVTDELVGMLRGSVSICNHVHIALQSGDDNIIRKMRRGYTARTFADRVLRLHGQVPDVSIGVDVIAGFPGEGEEEFNNTYRLLKDLPVSYLHIFPFSERIGTPAASFNGRPDPRTTRKRCELLRGLDTVKREAFYRASVGKTAEVLIEEKRDRKTGLPKGKTRNYITVTLEDPGINTNEIVYCTLKGPAPSGMSGRLSVKGF